MYNGFFLGLQIRMRLLGSFFARSLSSLFLQVGYLRVHELYFSKKALFGPCSRRVYIGEGVYDRAVYALLPNRL